MLPVLNNTRNNRHQKEAEGGESLSLSRVERRAKGQDPMCAKTGGLAMWTLTTQRTAGKHQLGLDSDTHSLHIAQRTVHHGALSTNTVNMTCSLKSIDPLTSYPSQQKLNYLPSDRNSLSNSFQPLRCWRDGALPSSSRFRSSTLFARWRETS